MAVIDFDLACVDCGAGLRGRALADACPACASAIARTIDPSLVDMGRLTVAADLTCRGCGYNLRTLALSAACPECSAPVVDSVRPDELRLANPTWLKTVNRGLALMLAALFAFAAIPVLMFVMNALSRGFDPFTALVAAAIAFAGWVALCFGVFGVTSRDPSQSTSPRTAAAVARLLVLSPLVAFAGIMITRSMAPRPWIGVALGPIVTLGPALAIGAGLVCLRPVARRAQRPGLARLTTVLIALMASTAALGIGAAVLSSIMSAQMSTAIAARAAAAAASQPAAVVFPMPNRLISTAVALSGCGTAILFVGCYIIALVAFFKYHALLQTAMSSSPSQRQSSVATASE